MIIKTLIRRFVPFSISYSIVILGICLLSLTNGITDIPLTVIWGTALIVVFIQTLNLLLYQINFRKVWHLYMIEYLIIFTVSYLLGSFVFNWYPFALGNAISMGLWMLFIYIVIIMFFNKRNKFLAEQINRAIQKKEEEGQL